MHGTTSEALAVLPDKRKDKKNNMKPEEVPEINKRFERKIDPNKKYKIKKRLDGRGWVVIDEETGNEKLSHNFKKDL